jgi:16S rRNA (uracil1498-N3)-methyltransferase
MQKFFVDYKIDDITLLDEVNSRHIAKSLRMKTGDRIVLCDGKGFDYNCLIESMNEKNIRVRLIEKKLCETEADVEVTIYQGLPKSDKMEFIIQKITELGCTGIVPVIMTNCVSVITGKEDRKRERWQRIALEAAQQSGRGKVPTVYEPCRFEEALKNCSGNGIIFYENGGENLKRVLEEIDNKKIGVFIGPEGGFTEDEIKRAKESGLKVGTLGKRILRTETAAVTAAALVLYETGNMN